MRIYKEEFMSPVSELTIRILINNVNSSKAMVGDHWHDYYEALYVMDGVASQTVGDETFLLNKDDILIIRPGEMHSTYSITDIGCSIMVLLFYPNCLNFDNYNSSFSKYLNLFVSKMSGYTNIYKPTLYKDELVRIISKMNEEYTLKKNGYNLILKGLVYEFLGYLQRVNSFYLQTNNNHNHYSKIIEACNFIENNYTEYITLKDISAKIGYSQEYFSALFKEYTGYNFKHFVDYVRISEADKLLKYEDISITAVSEKLNYPNISSFSRTYKRVKGYPPSKVANINY